MAGEKDRTTRLQKLSGSDFEIADGQPDIRGWDVKDGSGRHLGEVDELIFDYQSRKVRYLVLDLDDNELDLDDREVLVPIGIAELHENDDDVILSGVTAEQLRALPEYDEDRFDADAETSTRNVFGGLGAAAAAGTAALTGKKDHDDDFYNHEHFNEDNLYRRRRGGVDTDRLAAAGTTEGTDATIPVVKEELNVGKREVEAGRVRVQTRVVEEEATEAVSLRDETVKVERTPVDRPADVTDLREEEIELREVDEVPVVNKEARVVEEIHLHKDVQEREETIRDTVRNTEVDIDNEADRLRRDRDAGLTDRS